MCPKWLKRIFNRPFKKATFFVFPMFFQGSEKHVVINILFMVWFAIIASLTLTQSFGSQLTQIHLHWKGEVYVTEFRKSCTSKDFCNWLFLLYSDISISRIIKKKSNERQSILRTFLESVKKMSKKGKSRLIVQFCRWMSKL